MNNSIQKAGDVLIEKLNIITTKNTIIDLRDFLVELNIYEDMFSNCMRGSILLSDSRNLIQKGPILGEEFVQITVTTPTFEKKINKTFKVYSVSDRKIVRDNNTQMYILHFTSIELYYDILLPLYKSFEGSITQIVGNIFTDYIADTRNYDTSNTSAIEADDGTPLVILNETLNNVKFISPGWSPFKCINWLATKSIPKNEVAKNFLFFETNKAFYFGSVEYLLKEAVQNDSYIGEYTIAASNIRDNPNVPNINREFFIAKEVDMVETSDQIKNFTNGYLASRLITLDIYNKKYDVFDYDHSTEYEKQFHTTGSGTTSIPIFAKDGVKNPSTNVEFYPVNSRLYQTSQTEYFAGNISERMKDIYGNRRSSLLELSNLRMTMTIPGRTDIEVGHVLKFLYPGVGPKDKTTGEEDGIDTQYSGYYLITAMHHKINRTAHFISLECVKDSLAVDNLYMK